jgi:tripartite-type tricarboxylate transporter receptor subunit TctC
MVPTDVVDIAGFVRWVGENKAKATCGSPGTGSMPEFLAQRLEKLTTMRLAHVPYRGSAPAIQDLLGGQVSCVMSPLGDFVPYVAGGKLRVLGSTTQARSKFLPHAPTFAEQGLPQLTASEYYGVYAPARTPLELQERLASAIYRAVQVSRSIEMLDRMVMDPVGLSKEEFAKYLLQERAVWRDVVRDANFSPLD